MQKINVVGIVSGHVNSLRGEDGKLLLLDIVTFYLFPIIAGGLSFLLCISIPKDAVGLSVTVFSIFAALLLSVQVALYSVSLRPLTPPPDQKKKAVFERTLKERSSLIRELNDNISYLILLSVTFVTVLLVTYVVSPGGLIASSISIAVYVHFFLTILMVVKRASIVFSREYEN